jgi:hypothetical protein
MQALVLQHAVESKLLGLYNDAPTMRAHMCNGGKWRATDGVKPEQITSWIPGEDGVCPCEGFTCKEARQKLGFTNAPLFVYTDRGLRVLESQRVIAWGAQQSPYVAEKVAT